VSSDTNLISIRRTFNEQRQRHCRLSYRKRNRERERDSWEGKREKT